MKLSLTKSIRACDVLMASIEREVLRPELFAHEVHDYKRTNTPPGGEYLPFRTVDGTEKRFWVKADFRTPAAERDLVYYLDVSTGIGGWDALNPQMIMYLNGKMAQGLDVNHRRVMLEPDTDYKSVCYLYSGNQVAHFPVEYRLVAVNKRVEKLYFDMIVPCDACRDVYLEDSAEYATVMSALEQACNLLDLRDPGSEEFFEGVERAIRFMDEEFYGRICTVEGKPTVNCIAHSHIDVEWQWDRRQTREKIQRTASTAVALMKEYPEYRFMLSQPELYRYLKEEAPEKFAEVQRLVADGRWEPDGALYLECDCNIISGESMVRQLLYGKKFIKNELGRESRVCFLPDVFGYSAAMPQILKKSDVDYFVTSKISWNDTNTMPNDAFIWRGIDGTEIFSAFITGQDFNKNGPKERYTNYNGDINPRMVKGTWERFGQKEYCTDVINTFGHGDGGGGPTYQMLERGRRLSKGLPGIPAAKVTLLRPTLDAMAKSFGGAAEKLRYTPKWVGELYLEYHRGTYTSQARTKRGNRKSELALAATEALSVTDLCFGGDYDKENLDLMWRDLLHNQFHDILPGSSIKSVYEFAEADHARILAYSKNECERKLGSIAGKIGTDGGVLVYNPLGFERRGEIRVDGKTVTTEEAIPAFGYAVIKPVQKPCRVKIDGLSASNDAYEMSLNAAGQITKLYDKRAGRDVILPGERANRFTVHEDYPLQYDAWDIEEFTERKEYGLDTEAKIAPIFDGERAGFVIERDYRKSKIKQTLWLYGDSPRIDFEHVIDWHEKHNLLKLAFPINVHATEATCEIQFGHTTRPTHRNTSWDGAKFEVCAHKWVDVSEYGYGAALLNDCKYGHSVSASTVKLTCLKCPDFPDPTADEGLHEFTCSLLPHTGDLRAAGVIREAYALNQPLMALSVAEKNDGILPEKFSMISCDDPAVIIDGIKRAEDSDDLIVRMYESFGSTTNCKVKFANIFKKARFTNLVERDGEAVEIADNSISLTLSPFEIVTLRLSK